MAENNPKNNSLEWLLGLKQTFQNGIKVRHKIPTSIAGKTASDIVGYTSAKNYFYQHPNQIHGTFDRMTRFSDYAEMDTYAEINSALDIYASETVSADENGQVIKVISNNSQIKSIVNTLFNDILNIEYFAYSWARNTCKYGDFYLFLDIHPDNGIVGVYPIPVDQIEREEGFDKNNPFAARYRWHTNGNQILEEHQVVHFRLLGDDRFLPYGLSILEAVRRVYRQLTMLEDAVMVYRLVRSPERRVFKIDVGNIPPESVEAYVEKVKTKMKRQTVVNNDTSRVDLRYSALPIWKNTPIPLTDGRILTIEELSKEFQNGKENWVYSINDEKLNTVPGKVVWCGKNYTAQKMIKVWLDDGTWVMTAPEHPFVMRDGTSKKAESLTINESLMPFNLKLLDGNKVIFNPEVGNYEVLEKKDSNIEKTEHCRDDLKIINEVSLTSFENKESLYMNHKISKIEEIFESDDVYCMTVVGPNGEEDRHNFAVISFLEDGTFEGLSTKSMLNGIFLKNSVSDDYYIPVRAGTSSNVETLAGGAYTGDIQDIEYLQAKLFAGLKVPKAYLGYSEANAAQNSLAQVDIRFNKIIQRIQRTFESEFKKIAMIHLYCLGFRGEDLIDFNIKLAASSVLAAQQKQEVWRARLEMMNSLPDALPKRWAFKTIMGFDDDELEELFKDKVREAKEQLILDSISSNSSDSGDSGSGGGGGGGGLDFGGGGGDDFSVGDIGGIDGEEEMAGEPVEGEEEPAEGEDSAAPSSQVEDLLQGEEDIFNTQWGPFGLDGSIIGKNKEEKEAFKRRQKQLSMKNAITFGNVNKHNRNVEPIQRTGDSGRKKAPGQGRKRDAGNSAKIAGRDSTGKAHTSRWTGNNSPVVQYGRKTVQDLIINDSYSKTEKDNTNYNIEKSKEIERVVNILDSKLKKQLNENSKKITKNSSNIKIEDLLESNNSLTKKKEE